MRRSASEIIRNLEMRIARLEKQANIEWKVEGFPLDGDRLETYKFRGNERQFIKWFKGENLENLLDDIEIYGDGDEWEVYKGKLSRTASSSRFAQESFKRGDRVMLLTVKPGQAGSYANPARVERVMGDEVRVSVGGVAMTSFSVPVENLVRATGNKREDVRIWQANH